MIDGLKLTMTGEELRGLLQERVERGEMLPETPGAVEQEEYERKVAELEEVEHAS